MTDSERIVHVIERRPGQEIRATLSQFKGRTYASIRLYFRNEAGEWCPTTKGITLSADEIDQLEAAVRRLRDAIDSEPARRPDRIERYATMRTDR